jgi:hypothetical protein
MSRVFSGASRSKLFIRDDHEFFLGDLKAAHDFICIEILASLLRVILARERLPVWSKHAQ